MPNRRLLGGFITAFFLYVPAVPAGVPAAYDLQPGRTATYKIEIRTGEADAPHVFSGRVTYTVQPKQGNAAVLNYTGMVNSAAPAADGNGPQPQPVFGGLHFGIGGGGFLRLDARGRADRGPGALPWSAVSQQQLPYLLGPLSGLVLVELPETPTGRWESEGETQLQLASTLTRAVESPPGLSRSPFGVETQRSVHLWEERLTAVETTVYAAKEGAAEVERTYSLVTKERIGEKPRLEFRSTGTVRFADDGFLPEKVAWAGEIVWRIDGGERKTPISVTVGRVPQEEIARQAEGVEKARIDAAERIRKELDAIAEKLKSGNPRKAREAAGRLISSEPGKGDRRIAELLHEAVRSGDRSSRTEFGRALVRWATAEQAEMLLDLIDEPDQLLRHSAFDRLGQLRFEKAIPALAARLSDERDVWKVKASLKNFGPTAEPAVIEALRSDDRSARREAVNLLREIGTGKCLPALREATKDSDFTIRQAAEGAIRAIQERPTQPIA
jgi:hypothetical protein